MVDPARLPERRGASAAPAASRRPLARRSAAYARFAPPTYPADAKEADVVLFAGGGGSSIAVEQALGKHPDAALNHWPLAIGVHMRNFPDAEHHCADVMETSPLSVVPGRPIRLLWLSPDCRHFSPAKGSAIVSERIRALAWSAMPWVALRRPRVIMLENVEAFLTWGPCIVDAKGRTVPDPARKGETFAKWVARLERAGYVVDWRVLNAADYGEKTRRKRLFLVARCDGKPIVWPDATHGAPTSKGVLDGNLKPWGTAADFIQFDRDCPSIFLTKEAARKRYGRAVKRPLEKATLARIAKGLFRYTIASADPFLVHLTHQGGERGHSLRNPAPTITAANRGELALVSPSVMVFRRDSAGQDVREPLPTITANSHVKRPGCAAPLGLVAPILVPRYGERPGQEPRALSVEAPFPTVVPTGNGGQLVAAFVEQANTDMVGHDPRTPLSTIIGKGCTQRLVAASLTQLRGSNAGSDGDPGAPLASPTAQGTHTGVVAAHLDSYYATGCGGSAADPLRVATAQARHSLIAAELEADDGSEASWTRLQVLAFLRAHFGEPTEADYADPLGSELARARFGLVVAGGVVFRIVDIGMRMLDPEGELAAAMGVPAGYRWSVLDGQGREVRIPKTAITKMIGNMVCEKPAAALIAANFADEIEPLRVAA